MYTNLFEIYFKRHECYIKFIPINSMVIYSIAYVDSIIIFYSILPNNIPYSLVLRKRSLRVSYINLWYFCYLQIFCMIFFYHNERKLLHPFPFTPFAASVKYRHPAKARPPTESAFFNSFPLFLWWELIESINCRWQWCAFIKHFLTSWNNFA